MNYASVVLGGTFDRLHKGHQTLLAKAFSVGSRVTIGLTTDMYVERYKETRRRRDIENIASYAVRKTELEQWLDGQGWSGRYMIVPLDDPYGPTVNSSDFDAIVVSSETRKTADEINVKRNEIGLAPLALIEISLVPAEDLDRISSTRIRNGDIDAVGRLTLPTSLRSELKKSIGELISDERCSETISRDKDTLVITVGDMTTKKILDHGLTPALAIIDFQMERQPFLWDTESYARLTDGNTVISIQSGPGYISREAMEALQTWGNAIQGIHKGSTVFFIDGEEDLLVIPAIIEAPTGSVLYYGQPRVDKTSSRVEAGQPDKGMVRVLVTEEKKQSAKILLAKFI